MARLRVERVAEAIRSEVADILAREIKDPRLGFATVTDVEVSDDLRHVKVFVSVMGDKAQVDETMAALESATGFVRSEIGRRIRLRHTPEIIFRYDTSIKRGARVFELLKEIQSEKEIGNEKGGRE
ncbi:MAG: ribosome-binding factor [Bacillota bacterium]|nr:30S ribosome-binding factor RbfA [Bacillota bacterium]MDI6637279.1 30S ribosome-binding factor RbfA [Bacillota bacterium]MDK2930566.1 ribosome-binding factor [Bacillota bacterium]